MRTLLSTAREFVGYTARPNANDFLVYSQVTGDFQWDGSFVDAMIDKTASAGTLPKHANTTNALSFYVKNGWTRRVPKDGDLVFFAHPLTVKSGRYLSPRIGIVSSTESWKKNGSFRAIEGQTHSGLPRAPRDLNGVYERTHYVTDVLFFVRLPPRVFKDEAKLNGQPVPTLDITHTVRPAHLERCSSAQKTASAKPDHRLSTEYVQLALAEHPASRLRNADRFTFNGVTRSALASFQRFLGHTPDECDGSPNVRTLEQLSISPYTTRKFNVQP